MATIYRFEDLLAWQKARELSNAIDQAASQGRFALDTTLATQITRAAASVMDNIAEGFGRDGNKEFRQGLSQAKGSVYEVRSQIYKANDRHYLDPETYRKSIVLNQANRTADRWIHALPKKQRTKGPQIQSQQPRRPFSTSLRTENQELQRGRYSVSAPFAFFSTENRERGTAKQTLRSNDCFAFC